MTMFGECIIYYKFCVKNKIIYIKKYINYIKIKKNEMKKR